MENKTIDSELVILSKQTIDLFLTQENCADIIAVYTFYYYTAKWQQTNQIKAVDAYVMRGLHMGNITFKKAKTFLTDNDLIESIPRRDPSGKIKGWYIKINYIWSNQKVQNVTKNLEPEVLKPTSGEKETNALSANSINALKANTIAEVIPSNEYVAESPSDSRQILPGVVLPGEIPKFEPGQLPSNRGKTRIERVTSVYTDLFRDKYGFLPTLRMAAVGQSIDILAKKYTELQIAALLVSFFDWGGMTGNDDRERNTLTGKTHPFGWFYSTVNQYEAYLRNVFGLKFDDSDLVKEFVAKNLLAIKK